MPLPAELREFVGERLQRLRDAGVDCTSPELPRLLVASDYAFERLRRCPDALQTPPADALVLPPGEDATWQARLRRFRHAHSLQLIRDDLAGAPLERTLQHSSWLADHCSAVALHALADTLAERHGWPRRSDGERQQLTVFALGKLGGAELNFSSDIDLVFAFAEAGHSDGARPLDNESWFQRLGQRYIQLLHEVTADGFGFRVDMRLRPFGSAGRLVLSFAAMEHYFQRDGRDWERYAWIKARPMAGDVAAGEQLLATLRPFVYRRYLDYGAFEGLREMKSMIEAEVQRRDLAEHLKLGPGGIREIEFIVQLHQLLRGGREPELRQRGLLAALHALVARGHVGADAAARLEQAYRFLRRLENRLQMLRDEQVHELPEDPATRLRLAAGLGHPDWDALYADLEQHRAIVRAEFERVFEARRRGAGTHDAFERWWRDIDRDADPDTLAAIGVDAAVHAQMQGFARSPGVVALTSRNRALLDRVLPALLAAAARAARPRDTIERLLQLLHAVLRRPAYLALLDEQPAALQRLVEVTSGSALLAERLAAHPLLLDDLLDTRSESAAPEREEIGVLVRRSVAVAPPDDTEAALVALNEVRQSIAFRIAQATLLRRQSAAASAQQLAQLAEDVLRALLPLALRDLARAHGVLQSDPVDAGLAVIGYGSLGGRELGFGSDLDLVFVFDGHADADSDGPRPLDPLRYRQRAMQKVLALLSTQTPAGRLYEADLRLRPDGSKGLLLSSLDAFVDYQQQRAWTWEHQALVRARALVGAPQAIARFEQARAAVLRQPRDPAVVRRDVAAMRARMRGELDRGDASRFDLKQGRGGLVDLEFLLQAAVLARAAEHPALTDARCTPELIDAACAAGWFDAATAAALRAAHGLLLERSLACTLDARTRLVEHDAQIEHARNVIAGAWRGCGLGGAD